MDLTILHITEMTGTITLETAAAYFVFQKQATYVPVEQIQMQTHVLKSEGTVSTMAGTNAMMETSSTETAVMTHESSKITGDATMVTQLERTHAKKNVETGSTFLSTHVKTQMYLNGMAVTDFDKWKKAGFDQAEISTGLIHAMKYSVMGAELAQKSAMMQTLLMAMAVVHS